MKTRLSFEPHSNLAGEIVVEIWRDGQFIGTITGADGPGVRIISKHAKNVTVIDPMILEVRIKKSASN